MDVPYRGMLPRHQSASKKLTRSLQGLITLCIGLLSFGMMPAGPTETASWFRGKKGWFTERYEQLQHNFRAENMNTELT